MFHGRRITLSFAGLDHLHMHRTRCPQFALTVECDELYRRGKSRCKYIHSIRGELCPRDNDGVRYPILRYVCFAVESAPIFAAKLPAVGSYSICFRSTSRLHITLRRWSSSSSAGESLSSTTPIHQLKLSTTRPFIQDTLLLTARHCSHGFVGSTHAEIQPNILAWMSISVTLTSSLTRRLPLTPPGDMFYPPGYLTRQISASASLTGNLALPTL